MKTAACPENPVQYLENNLFDLVTEPDLENMRGARLAVEYIAAEYPDSAALTELYRSISGLAVSKTLPANRERPADNRWRAQALLALAQHKVGTRDEIDERELTEDIELTMGISEPYNRRGFRTGWLEPYMNELLAKDKRTPSEETATRVLEDIFYRYSDQQLTKDIGSRVAAATIPVIAGVLVRSFPTVQKKLARQS